jgi:hypothetical protein
VPFFDFCLFFSNSGITIILISKFYKNVCQSFFYEPTFYKIFVLQLHFIKLFSERMLHLCFFKLALLVHNALLWKDA